MPQTRVRVAGSGFTTFNYRGKPIAFLDGVTDSGQRPIVGPEAITPLDARHPVEIATPRVLSEGTLTATMRELWNEPVWFQLSGLAGADTIIDVFERLAQEPDLVTCQLIIKPPGGVPRGKLYHNCVVSNIDDGENILVQSLSVQRNITIMYTHTTPLTRRAA